MFIKNHMMQLMKLVECKQCLETKSDDFGETQISTRSCTVSWSLLQNEPRQADQNPDVKIITGALTLIN